MSEASIIEIITQSMWVAAKISAPVLLTAMFVGIFVGLLQSVTQIQEQSLAFVPKFGAVGVAIAISGNWMVQTMVSFTRELILRIPELL